MRPDVDGVGRDALWTAGQAVVGALTSLGVLVLAARRLDPDEFGAYSLVIAAAALTTLLDLGLGTTVVRTTVAAGRGDREALADLRIAIGLHRSIGLGLLAASGIGALLLFRAGEAPEGALVLSYGFGQALAAATGALPNLLVGTRRFRHLAVASSCTSLTTAAVAFVAVPRLGVAALGLAHLTGTAAGRRAMAAAVRTAAPWYPLRAVPVPTGRRRVVVSAAGSLTVLSIAGLVLSATDLFVIGALVTPAAVGLYRAGATLPAQLAGLIYRCHDVVLPALLGNSDPEQRRRVVALLTRLLAFVLGGALAVVALNRHVVITLILGRTNPLAEDVLLLFCLTWSLSSAAHGLALLAIARQRHGVLLPVVGIELVANVALTVILVATVGPVAGAWATLVTLGTSNLLLVPKACRSVVRAPSGIVIGNGLTAVIAAWVVAGAATAIAHALSDGVVALLASSVIAVLLFLPAVWLCLGADGRRLLASRRIVRSSPLPAPA